MIGISKNFLWLAPLALFSQLVAAAPYDVLLPNSKGCIDWIRGEYNGDGGYNTICTKWDTVRVASQADVDDLATALRKEFASGLDTTKRDSTARINEQNTKLSVTTDRLNGHTDRLNNLDAQAAALGSAIQSSTQSLKDNEIKQVNNSVTAANIRIDAANKNGTDFKNTVMSKLGDAEFQRLIRDAVLKSLKEEIRKSVREELNRQNNN